MQLRIIQKFILALKSDHCTDSCIHLKTSLSEMTKAWQCNVTAATIKTLLLKRVLKVMLNMMMNLGA